MKDTRIPTRGIHPGRFRQRTTAAEIVDWFAASSGHFRQVNRAELAVSLARPASTVRAAFRKLLAEGVVIELSGHAWRPGGPVDAPLYKLAEKHATEGQTRS